MSGKSLSQVDWADVGVEFTKGAITGFAPGLGVVARGALDYGGEVVKAAIDVTADNGVQTVVNGTKSWASAGVDLTTNVVFKLGFGEATKALGNSAKAATMTAKNAAISAANKETKAVVKTVAGNSTKSAGYSLRKASTAAVKSANAASKSAVVNTSHKTAAGKVGSVVQNVGANKTSDAAKDKLKVTQ